MKRKYLYGIIIILFLCCFGFISLPFLKINNCDNPKEKTMYLRLGFANLPITINVCEV